MSSSTRPRRDRGQTVPLLLVVVLFIVLALVVNRSNDNPEIRRINLVAQQYADAWQQGRLDSLEFDPLSNPEVGAGDPQRIAANVTWITRDLDPTGAGKPRPSSVTVERDQTRRDPADQALATTRLRVTWNLQPTGLQQTGHNWTYDVLLRERLSDGRWRVVWTPDTVHPAVRHGLVLRVTRAQPPRASLLGAGDTVLPPAGQPRLASAVLGSITSKASYEQAQLAALRAKPNDTIGVAGLQNIYDARLAGGAQITVTAQLVAPYKNISPPQSPLFVGPPETPRPVKLTLDARTQGLAERALTGLTGPATLVVVRPSTGELLAVANTTQTVDYGLSAQQPPGSVFGVTSLLAMLRSGYSLTNRIDCTAPYTFGGQVFRNAQGPNLQGVTLGAAIEGGCVTGLARVAGDVAPDTLQNAAYDLGTAAPRDTVGGTPGLLTVADQLGTPAFHGSVPLDSGDALHHAEDLIGEGNVLVSPLSMTRATATVASGTRRAVRLIVDPAPATPDSPRALSPDEVDALREAMAKAVTELGGSAHALASIGGEIPHAMAGSASYGTGPAATRQAWCTGYRGDYAFTVLVPGSPAAQGATPALTIAANFLRLIG